MHAIITARHTWIFKRESTAFVACWLYDVIGDSGKGLSFVSSDEKLLFPLALPPANNARAHELGLLLFDDDDDELGIFTASDFA